MQTLDDTSNIEEMEPKVLPNLDEQPYDMETFAAIMFKLGQIDGQLQSIGRSLERTIEKYSETDND